MDEIKEMLAEIVGLLSEQNESAKEILNDYEAARVLNLSKSHVNKLEYLTRYRTASADEIQTQANAIIYRKRR